MQKGSFKSEMWTTTSQKLAVVRQYLTTVIVIEWFFPATSSFALVGHAAGWPSPILIKMQNHETPVILEPNQISWMVSLMYLGHLLSPIPSGIMMDRIGRRKSLLLLAILPVISWLIILKGTCALELYCARLIAGLWAGATSTIIPIYVGEIAEPQLRGSLTVFSHMMRNFGVLSVYLVGPFLSYHSIASACALSSVLFTLIVAIIPETPHYLIMKCRNQEANQTLSWLRGGEEKNKVDEEIRRIKDAIKHQLKSTGSFKDVWYSKGNRKAFIISEVYSVAKRLTGSGVLQAYISITLPPLTFGLFEPNDCVIILGFISLLSSIASIFLSVHFNRRTLISFSSAGCGLSMTLIAIWFYLNFNASLNVKSYSDWLFVCFIIYNATFSVGLGPVGTSIKGELFPANVKALCSSLTTILVAITSFILNKFFLLIAESFGMYFNFFIYALSSFATIVFTYMYVPDTQGKTLEEIQQILHNYKYS